MTTALLDIDEVAVERACAGDRTVNLASEEMAAALALLTRRGVSGRMAARVLGVSDRRVWRWKAGAKPHGRRAVA